MSQTEYSFTDEEAKDLLGAVALPDEMRKLILQKYLNEHGEKKLINLFSQFIGMANSVGDNTEELVTQQLLLAGIIHPDRPNTKPNLPTVFGALIGVSLANGVDEKKVCQECAFRKGSTANQCASTTIDADWCAKEGADEFQCHIPMTLKENGKTCRGYAQARRKHGY